jgi:penicillin-binding protein 1C
VLESKKGELLSAKIAQDGQWRFPKGESIPEKFSTCIQLFEDEYFFYHPGINPISMFRATKQNWKAGKIVSGGSTLTMQIVRMARKGKPRTVWQKLIEVFWSLRLELRYSKEELLQLYASHAPFGGNVVGLEAASWRYYNRPPHKLSWAETATLAVLPNAPSLIFPGRNQDALLEKRNRLLKKLEDKKILDAESVQLAMSEQLPQKPHHLPQEAIHLLNRSLSEGKEGQRLRTTIDKEIQQNVNQLVNQQYLQLKQNGIHNLAVLVLDNKKNEVLSYVGNSNGRGQKHGHRVDVITAKRSTGSLLKPFLYGLAWQDGLILPNSLLADIPTQFGGYAPKNFNKEYDGAVPASKALIQSLNIPAVRLLKEYGLERFYDELNRFPIPSINRGSGHYGLSIILGGAEASLWEMSTAYKGMSESLRSCHERMYNYEAKDYDFPKWLVENDEVKIENSSNSNYSPVIKAGAIWQLVESLRELNRPGQEEGWESFEGRRTIAWKTGTSFGFRDAWAIGVCPEYTIGVWVGNADGEGRPGLTGISAAAPILFEAFNLLGESTWYTPPHDELYPLEVCRQSGFKKGLHCNEFDTLLTVKTASHVKTCPYHETIQLNNLGTKRVNSSCYAVADMQQKPFLVLPPLMEWYYRKKEPSYQVLPPWDEGCKKEATNPMELISPEQADKILIPIELGGTKGRLVVEVAHRNPYAKIYWHVDENYYGESEGVHSKEMDLAVGKHVLTLVDAEGNTLTKHFEVVESEL